MKTILKTARNKIAPFPPLLRALLISFASVFLFYCANAGAAGFQHVTANDPDGAPLEVGIWYPSAATPAPVAMRAVTQTVAVDADIAGTKLPLIVISHGTSGSYLGHYDTAIALANAGFVVAAVTHTGDNNVDQSRSLFIMERPRHISRLLDYMLSSWNGRDHIDQQKIGMFGFSAGGFTTLVSIGGHPDMTKIAPFCQTHTTDFACQLSVRNQRGIKRCAHQNRCRGRTGIGLHLLARRAARRHHLCTTLARGRRCGASESIVCRSRPAGTATTAGISCRRQRRTFRFSGAMQRNAGRTRTGNLPQRAGLRPAQVSCDVQSISG